MRRALSIAALIAACARPTVPAAPPKQPARVLAPAFVAPPTPPPAITGTGLAYTGRRGDGWFRQGDVYSLAISRDGRFGLTGSTDGRVAVWDLGSLRLLQLIETGQGAIFDLAISDDGKWLTVVGSSNTLQLWDAVRGVRRWELNEFVRDVRFTPDGRRLAVGVTPRLLDAADGRVVWEDHAFSSRNVPYAVSDDARVLARIDWAPSGNSISILGPDRKELSQFPAATASDVSLSPSGDRLGVLDDTSLRVYATATGKPLANVPLTSLAADSRRVLLGDNARHALVWNTKVLVGFDLVTGRETWRAALGSFHGIQIAGTVVVESAGDESCRARRLSDGKELWQHDQCEKYAAAGAHVFTAYARTALDVLDAASGKARAPATSSGPIGEIQEIAVSPDGTRFVTLSWDHSLWLWDASTSVPRRLVDPPGRLSNASLQFLSPTILAVVEGSSANALHAMQRPVIHRYDIDRNRIDGSREIALTDGPILGPIHGEELTVYERGESACPRTVFDLRDQMAPRRLPAWKRALERAVYPSDWDPCTGASLFITDIKDQRVYIASDHKIRAWDAANARVVATCSVPGMKARACDIPDVAGLALVPDEHSLLVLRENAPAVVFDAKKLRQTATLEAVPEQAPSSMMRHAISPDSKLVAAVSGHGLYLWRIADGALLATVTMPSKLEAPSSLAFAPDTKKLWVGTTIGNVLEFAVAP